MVWNKIKSVASTVKAAAGTAGSAATAGSAGKLLTFLMVFVFYYPLIINR